MSQDVYVLLGLILDVYVLLGLILTPVVFIGIWMLFFFWMGWS